MTHCIASTLLFYLSSIKQTRRIKILELKRIGCTRNLRTSKRSLRKLDKTIVVKKRRWRSLLDNMRL